MRVVGSIDRPNRTGNDRVTENETQIVTVVGGQVATEQEPDVRVPCVQRKFRLEFRWVLRVVLDWCRMKTIESLLESHGPRESFELS